VGSAVVEGVKERTQLPRAVCLAIPCQPALHSDHSDIESVFEKISSWLLLGLNVIAQDFRIDTASFELHFSVPPNNTKLEPKFHLKPFVKNLPRFTLDRQSSNIFSPFPTLLYTQSRPAVT
jgi:hypothetical protein